MTSLKSLYYGNIFPVDKDTKHGIEYSKPINVSVRNEEKLVPTPSKEQKVIFEKYKDCINEITAIAGKKSFIQGIKLGLKTTAETFLTDLYNLKCKEDT